MLKIFRFFKIYGFYRTLIKVVSRTEFKFLRLFFLMFFIGRKRSSLSLIGCGQFGFSTISYFLLREKGNLFLECYDLKPKRSKFTSYFFGYKHSVNLETLFGNPKLRYIYIASDHFSHCDYAIKALNMGVEVYCEKPIIVNWEQFDRLVNAIQISTGNFFAGYNRPFSKSVQFVKEYIINCQFPISLSCFISGHFIEANHWYREERQGTRICGNVGHWIDLMINLMSSRGEIPGNFEIAITYADKVAFDDNLVISFSTDYGDVVSIFITSRSEPFEGINETINIQCSDFICKIDDFRSIQIWKGSKHVKKKFFPKDVGHKKAILQPFSKVKERDVKEVVISSYLMLMVKDLVRDGAVYRKVSIPKNLLEFTK